MIIGALAFAPMSPDARSAASGSLAGSGRPLAIAAVIAWVLTVSIGVYMLRTWVARGGLHRQRTTGVGVPPLLVFGHAAAALTGLAIWISFLKTGWDPLAWLGVVLITLAIALGVCTVTLWTPYPVRVPAKEGKGGPGGWVDPVAEGSGAPGSGVSPGGGVPPREDTSPPREDTDPDTLKITDEMIASLLAEPFPVRRRPRLKLVPLIPVGHGFAALTTFMLAVLAAISARLGMFRAQ